MTLTVKEAAAFARREILKQPMRTVLIAVANECGVTPGELVGPSRREPLALARQYAYWRLRNDGHSFGAIGALMNRDHSTIVVGVRRFEERASA